MNCNGAARTRMAATGEAVGCNGAPSDKRNEDSPDCTLQRQARLEALKSLKNPNEPHAGC